MINGTVAAEAAKSEFRSQCKDNNMPIATQKLIEAICKAICDNIKSGTVTTTVTGTCSTGAISGTGTGSIK